LTDAPGRRERLFVLAAAALASIAALLWSWRNHAFLLYGDAEAHIHIARRLFDSHRPGITQLGSVWLPLPHLLMVPFVAIDPWWRSGFGPAIPSALCYILGCLGLYRLARKWLSPAASVLALAFFALNPNLLYLQTTAMTEPLFLCELIWSVLLLVDWYESLRNGERRAERLLWAVIAVLICAVYTRYDGWILAFLAWAAMAVCLHRRGQLFRRDFVLASILLTLAPAGWMLYNAVVFQDWLDFMRGPYSAKAIEARTASSAIDPHPGWHNPWVSLQYFLKAAEMDAASRAWGWLIFGAALAGTSLGWLQSSGKQVQSFGFIIRRSSRSWLWTLFLWLPLPFYAYSVSYGSVPIFLPVWKPFSWYNTRYGMELLPAFAFFAGFTVEFLLQHTNPNRRTRRTAIFAACLVLLLANSLLVMREHPLTYIEARKNTAARGYYNGVIPAALARLHQLDPSGEILMNTSMYPSFIPNAGLTYRQTINESDKQFYWAALGYPAAHASIVLAFAGDDIDKAVHAHPEHLRVYQRFHSPNQGWDQGDATLYVTDTFPGVETTPLSTPTPAR
jgi:4-amino-4-deoxy-L-arabinose transferase-like glycosyltransferase